MAVAECQVELHVGFWNVGGCMADLGESMVALPSWQRLWALEMRTEYALFAMKEELAWRSTMGGAFETLVYGLDFLLWWQWVTERWNRSQRPIFNTQPSQPYPSPLLMWFHQSISHSCTLLLVACLFFRTIILWLLGRTEMMAGRFWRERKSKVPLPISETAWLSSSGVYFSSCEILACRWRAAVLLGNVPMW